MRNYRIQISTAALMMLVMTGCQSGVGWPHWDWWRTAKTDQENTSTLARSASPQLPPLPSYGASPATNTGSSLAQSGTNSYPYGGNNPIASYPTTASSSSTYPNASYPTTQASGLASSSSATVPAAGYTPSYPASRTAPQTGPYDPNAYGSGTGSLAAGSGTRVATSLGRTGASPANSYPTTSYGAQPTTPSTAPSTAPSGLGGYPRSSYSMPGASTSAPNFSAGGGSAAISNPPAASSYRNSGALNPAYPGSGSTLSSPTGGGNRYAGSTGATSIGPAYGAATSPPTGSSFGAPTTTTGPTGSGQGINTGNTSSPAASGSYRGAYPTTGAGASNLSPPPAGYPSPVVNQGIANSIDVPTSSSYAGRSPGTSTHAWPTAASKYRPGGTSDYTPQASSPTSTLNLYPPKTSVDNLQNLAPPLGTVPTTYPSPYSPAGGVAPLGTAPIQGAPYGTSGSTSRRR